MGAFDQVSLPEVLKYGGRHCRHLVWNIHMEQAYFCDLWKERNVYGDMKVAIKSQNAAHDFDLEANAAQVPNPGECIVVDFWYARVPK